MDDNYKATLKDPLMKERLFRIENIDAIEDILDREIRELNRLERLEQNGKLDFGETLSLLELRETFPGVCTEVNSILQIPNQDTPQIEYFKLINNKPLSYYILAKYTLSAASYITGVVAMHTGWNSDFTKFYLFGGFIQFVLGILTHVHLKGSSYSRSSKKVVLDEKKEVNAVSASGHEYVHFIQDKEEIPLNNFQIFLEGHAIGTHKQHVALRCEKEDNEAYLYNRAQYNVSELRSAYLCLCSDLEIKPRRSLLQNNLINTLRKDKELMIVKNASSHSIGNALFSIYEAIHGKDIYRQMIHGEFVFT